MFADLMVSGKKQRFVLIIYVIKRFRYFVFIYPDRLRGCETQQELLVGIESSTFRLSTHITHSLSHSQFFSHHTHSLTYSPIHSRCITPSCLIPSMWTTMPISLSVSDGPTITHH